MSYWKKLALGASTALTLMALAVTAGGASAALRAAAGGALARTAAPVDALAGGGGATSIGVPPIQVSIGSDWTLHDKLTMTGTVTATCGPFLPGPNHFSSAFVDISEAAGHTIAHAGGSFAPACDGVTRAYAVTATAFNVPLRPGTGSATAGVSACGVDPVSFQFVCLNGQAGPQEISIRK